MIHQKLLGNTVWHSSAAGNDVKGMVKEGRACDMLDVPINRSKRFMESSVGKKFDLLILRGGCQGNVLGREGLKYWRKER